MARHRRTKRRGLLALRLLDRLPAGAVRRQAATRQAAEARARKPRPDPVHVLPGHRAAEREARDRQGTPASARTLTLALALTLTVTPSRPYGI